MFFFISLKHFKFYFIFVIDNKPNRNIDYFCINENSLKCNNSKKNIKSIYNDAILDNKN